MKLFTQRCEEKEEFSISAHKNRKKKKRTYNICRRRRCARRPEKRPVKENVIAKEWAIIKSLRFFFFFFAVNDL